MRKQRFAQDRPTSKWDEGWCRVQLHLRPIRAYSVIPGEFSTTKKAPLEKQVAQGGRENGVLSRDKDVILEALTGHLGCRNILMSVPIPSFYKRET